MYEFFLAIPRMKLRKRTASETLRHVLTGLHRAMEAIFGSVNSTEGKTLMYAVIIMAQAAWRWAKDLPELTNQDLQGCQVCLYAFFAPFRCLIKLIVFSYC